MPRHDSPGTAAAECVADVEHLASARLPAAVRDYVAGGSAAELTLTANRLALDAIGLIPRMLAGVETVDTTTRLVADEVAMPVAVAPMAYQRLVHPDGELAVARAAKTASIPFVASTLSSCTIERIAAEAGPVWFQLYWMRDRGLVAELVGRAQAAGCTALMLTLDVPIMARRLRDIRNRFVLPPHVTAANLTGGDGRAHDRAAGGSAIAAHTAAVFEPALRWQDLDWLCGLTSLPLVLKGILDPLDAVRAVDAGAEAIVVSNHGGRQLDGAVPPVSALPAVVEHVAGRAQVLLDSGIRSGTDVVRALAIGAQGVLIGRPVLWGLALDGEQGVEVVLRLLAAELRDALHLAGCPDVVAAQRIRAVLAPILADAGRYLRAERTTP